MIKQAVFLILMLGVGFILGYSSGKSGIISSIKQSLTPIEEHNTSYSFVHPLLAYRTPEATLLGDYVSLKSAFGEIINSATHSGVSRVSVYFRDLDVGRWVGINQDDAYYPASLLKVPAMIAYYKEADDEDPSILTQRLSYDSRVLPGAPFDAPSTLVNGHSYSIQELIRRMIVDSDNGATYALLDYINSDFLHSVYIALGVPDPEDDSANYKISARTYGLFFRVLYNTTYLSPAFSERALQLLSETSFTNGLVAGVPTDTPVAHKYGEHVLSQGGVASGIELSDCGIVYYPAHPYLLCVMTSSNNGPAASAIIGKISTAAYAAVSAKYASVTSVQ